MKNYQVIVLVLAVFFVLISFFNLKKVYEIDYLLQSHKSYTNKMFAKKKLSNDFIKQLEFKESSYIRQQSNDTTLLLTVFTITIGIFSFLIVYGSKERFTTFTSELNDKYAEIENKYESNQKKLKSLSIQIDLDKSYLDREKAKMALKENKLDLFIEHSLSFISKEVSYYHHLIEFNEDSVAIIVFNSIISSVEELYNQIKNEDKIEVLFDLEIQMFLNQIRVLSDSELHRKLAKIQAKLAPKMK